MLEFKKWILNEIVELKKPTNPIKKRNFIKNAGTNRPTPSIEYKFITKLGNEVKIHFDINGDDEYRVIFYVNNTLFSDSSKKEGIDRDPEILAGVFNTVKEKAKKLGAKKLRFEAHKNKEDDKIVKNIKIEPLKEKLLYDLKLLYQNLSNHKVTMIPPSERQIELAKKFNRQIGPKPDVDVENLTKELNNVISAVSQTNNENKFEALNKIGMFSDNIISNIYPNSQIVKQSLSNFRNAIMSHSEQGFTVVKNKRKNIYEKLIQRYFLDEWNYEISYNHFTLTRKQDVRI